jgi:hypothetical protein
LGGSAGGSGIIGGGVRAGGIEKYLVSIF